MFAEVDVFSQTSFKSAKCPNFLLRKTQTALLPNFQTHLNIFIIIYSKHRCLNPRIDFKIISLGFMSKLDSNPLEDLVPSIK